MNAQEIKIVKRYMTAVNAYYAETVGLVKKLPKYSSPEAQELLRATEDLNNLLQENYSITFKVFRRACFQEDDGRDKYIGTMDEEGFSKYIESCNGYYKRSDFYRL